VAGPVEEYWKEGRIRWLSKETFSMGKDKAIITPISILKLSNCNNLSSGIFTQYTRYSCIHPY